MTPERWQQVNELFKAALERAPEERAAFVNRACAGDEELREEIESLLASYQQGSSFMETPAVAAAAHSLLCDQAESLVGRLLGHYEVVALLEEGGMGQVYLAQDTQLGRRVALKLLPGHMSQNADSLRRFAQEARTASSLNHPNVCMIHEVGETEDLSRYIVMEYVEGLTLRRYMAENRLALSEALDISIQIASALSAAHEVGVVHRDMKPDNAMLRRDGIVKVLDFGLAKLTEKQPAADQARPVRPRGQTETGMVLGTAAYMSPEQARGLAVDARTDIWSLGVVLYEMIAGQRPFEGATNSDVIVSVLEREPPPLTRFSAQAPAELQRIVIKALCKDREKRYQTARDLLGDLKGLRRELEIKADVARSKQTITNSGMGVTTSRFRVIASRLFPLRLMPSRILILTTLMGMLIIAGLVSALFFRQSQTPAPQSGIKSLAVLPLKSLSREVSDHHLGLGIADTLIMKVSQVGGLVVRPTSAVRKFADREVDSLEAARQLQADSVLDGTFLQAGDRLRVSVNLLRVSDGASLWAETFDLRFTDIFAIQDEVSKEVAARLRVKLSPAEQARLVMRHTTKPEAYAYYSKAMYHFGERGFAGDTQEEMEIAIDLLKKAVEIDPNYALARAWLGFSYAWIADFKDEGPALMPRAKEELRAAERLDPQLAEVHAARSFIFWTRYEGWKMEAAIREARLARHLNSNLNMLPALYYHIGLEEQAAKEFESALEQDPTSDMGKRTYLAMYYFLARPDDWLALNQRFFNGVVDTRYHLDRNGRSRYYLEKRMLKEAAPLIEQEYAKNPDTPEARRDLALLLALQGQHEKAQAAVPRIIEKLRKDKVYHHFAYDIARIFALDGKSKEALKWLRITVEEGFPCYTLFARDAFLDPIRKDPAFIQFMIEMKTRWEGYRREFG